VGILADNKNQRRLLEAWKILQHRFADFPALVLVGPNEGLYTQKVIRPLIDSLSRPGEVLLTGRISDTELEGWYRHALAYVQPSIAEGFGLPLVEAMARGIPVASSNTTSLPETAGDAAVYFDPMDPEQMASILEKLWQSGPLRRDLVTLGCERVKLFSWEHHARIVAETIEAELRRI
jgi:glycosyltransferase involved in cell wall biosynthesis